MQFTQAKARQTLMIEFRHIDGTLHGGVVGGTVRDTFSVVSFPIVNRRQWAWLGDEA